MDRTELWHQLENAITLRSAQDQVLWAVFGAFWGSNAVLLVALFKDGDFPTNPWVGVVIAATGSLLSWVWFLIQGRALAGIRRHETLMRAVEDELQLPDDRRVMTRVTGGIRARRLMPMCSVVAGVLWILASCVFIHLTGRL